MPFTGKKLLLFPVETTVRELDFRLILAALCVNNEREILVGEHELLFSLSMRMRDAVIVLKNITGGKRPWKYRRYKELGMRIVQLDEEGAIFEGEKDNWRKVLNNRLIIGELEPDDYVCTWGSFQADHYHALAPARAERVIPTGHPRLDLGKEPYRRLFAAEAERLRALHGKFILINTNLLANNALGPDVLLRHYKVPPEDKEQRGQFIGQYAHEASREGAFINLFNALSDAFPDRKIIIRPHPSENIGLYKALLPYIPRTTVTRTGSLHAWLLSASVLIHGGCTTAIEGYLCGTPVINFQPLVNPRYDISLPNMLGVSCRTQEEVIGAVRNLDSGAPSPPPAPEQLAALREMLSNFDSGGDAFASVAEVISKACEGMGKPVVGSGGLMLFGFRVQGALGRVTHSFRRLRKIFHSRDRGFEKFPPLDPVVVAEKIAIIREITGKDIRAKFLSNKIISITSGGG